MSWILETNSWWSLWWEALGMLLGSVDVGGEGRPGLRHRAWSSRWYRFVACMLMIITCNVWYSRIAKKRLRQFHDIKVLIYIWRSPWKSGKFLQIGELKVLDINSDKDIVSYNPHVFGIRHELVWKFLRYSEGSQFLKGSQFRNVDLSRFSLHVNPAKMCLCVCLAVKSLWTAYPRTLKCPGGHMLLFYMREKGFFCWKAPCLTVFPLAHSATGLCSEFYDSFDHQFSDKEQQYEAHKLIWQDFWENYWVSCQFLISRCVSSARTLNIACLPRICTDSTDKTPLLVVPNRIGNSFENGEIQNNQNESYDKFVDYYFVGKMP